MPNRESTPAKLMMLSSMVIFATIGLFRTHISLPSSALAFARGLIGAGFLLLLQIAGKKKLSMAAIRRNMLPLCLSGAFLGINWILLFEAYLYAGVPTATLCYYMAPTLVILASPLLLKEKMTLKKALCAGAALLGMIPVSGVLDKGAMDQSPMVQGVLLGLAAAVFYAAVIFTNKKIQGMEGRDTTIVQLLVSSFVLLPYVLLTEDISAFTLGGVEAGLVVCVGILHTGVAYACYFGAIGRLSGNRIALYSYLDPILALVLAALLLPGQGMDLPKVLGAVMILGAALISEWPARSAD